MDWFLYNRDFHHEKVKCTINRKLKDNVNSSGYEKESI